MTSAATSADLPDVVGREPAKGISVLIVGSGIGGLTAARECWRRGFDVRVLERSEQPVLTGDSFTIGPSALKSLRNFPRLLKEVQGIGTEPRISVLKLDGSLIKGPFKMSDMATSKIDSETASYMLRLSRPKLYRLMSEHLARLGVVVEHGRRVVDYFEDNRSGRAGVVLKDGSRHEADLVVAADGANGHSQQLVTGCEVPARPSGDAIFRVSCPIEQALSDPVVAETCPMAEDGAPAMRLYTG